MNKKNNTLLFVLGATLFNILVTFVSFVVLTLIYVKFIMVAVPEQSRAWIFALIFFAAVVFSFLVYRLVLKFIFRKIRMEDYFDPIFTRRNIRRN